MVIKQDRSDKIEIKKCHENIGAIALGFQEYHLAKILFKTSAAASRGGPGPFQGPSSYPQLVVADLLKILKCPLPLYIGAALGPIGGFGVVTLLPVLARDWSVDFGTASLAISFYIAPFVIVQIFSGSIAQLFDTRRALFFSFVTYFLGCVACGLSPNPAVLFSSRAVLGLGAGFLTPIIMALIGELVPEKHVGSAMGGLGVAYTVGVTLDPLLSGIIDQNAIQLFPHTKHM